MADDRDLVCRGKVVLDRTTKGPKLNCRNWESGVLIPFGKFPDDPLGNADITPDLWRLNKIFPVPIQLPAQKLLANRPWFFMRR